MKSLSTGLGHFGLLALLGACFVQGCSSGDDFSQAQSGGAAGTGASGGSGGGSGDAGTTGGAAGTGAKKQNGATCSASLDCTSAHCVDGFCCDSSCNGTCERCDVAGSEGTCTPNAAGTDPEGECVGAGAATDPCAGRCDGQGACAYPGSETTCGATTCTAGKQAGSLCDGQGACTTAEASCEPYLCNATQCATTCTSNGECVATTWCNTGSCEPKKQPGLTCGDPAQCATDLCEQGVCCKTACQAPFTCNSSGTCVCGTDECASGDQCITWYADKDKDGFGDPNTKAFGCASKAPSGGPWVKNDQDCYDANVDAKPGQTQFFIKDRGDGSFDYDCNGNPEPKYGVVSPATCKLCPCSAAPTCAEQASFGCSVIGCPKITAGFAAAVACGQPGTLSTCKSAMLPPPASTCNAYTETATGTLQPCR